MEPVVVPETREDTFAALDRLTEIQAHREWVIEGLRAHVANIEHDLDRARARVDELEKHTRNVEFELAGMRAHALNLEERLEARERRLAEIEAEAERLEQRVRGHRIVRFSGESILPRTGHASIDALTELGNRIWHERPDLQRRFPRDRAADFWYWLHWDLDANPDLERIRLPIPDPHLRDRVRGSDDATEYRRSGLVDWWRIDGCLRRGGFDPVAGGTVLDFGAGCGRIAQYFTLYHGHIRLVGCDVDPEATRWCVKNLDFASFTEIALDPPTPFADASFDAIYGFSVFSHLPEASHLRWLAELRRILRPGGVLVLSLHGQQVVDEIAAGRALPRLQERAQEIQNELLRTGFAFVPYERMSPAHSENAAFFSTWDLASYGDTFIVEPYWRRHWADVFEIVAHIEAPEDWQDYVILRRR
jgi:SAM-dependent methyltransferase